MSQVNFLCIGAQKAGTSWLYAALQLHPEVTLHPIKELHFFDCKYADSRAVLRRRMVALKSLVNHFYPVFSVHDNLDPRLSAEHFSSNKSLAALNRCKLKANLRLAFGSYSDAMYLELFPGLEGKIVGEITPAYSSLPPRAIKSIHALLGDIKIIYMIRHPVPRAWSSFKMLCESTGLDINAMDPNSILQTVNEPRMLRYLDVRSDYVAQTRLWKELFPTMHFIRYDDLALTPELVLRNVCDFLKLEYQESFFQSILGKRVNQGGTLPIPEAVRDFLAQRYQPQIDFVEAQFGLTQSI